MKKIMYYGIVFLILSHGKIFSQDEIPQLFDNVSTVSIFRVARLSNSLNDPINKEFRFVRFSNLSKKITSKFSMGDTYFKFTIPKGRRTRGIKNVLSIPKHIEAEESGNYTYYSDLTYGKNGKGSLVLMYYNGHSYGSMQLGNRYFRIESLSKDIQILIELDSKILNSKDACATDHNTLKKNIITQPNYQTKASCNSRNVRVLVMFTNAANRISNPNQLANIVIANTNRSLYNSRIYSSNLRFQLAGIKKINWNESNSANNDLYEDLVNNEELNNERENHGADLVVVLTNGSYSGVLGIAALNQYSDANTGHVAIVQASTVGGLTFAHELGHLMGCRHDSDNRTGSSLPNNLSKTAKGHVWYYRNWFLGRKHYQKSVVAGGLSRGSRVMHYSNPSVKAHRKARDQTGNRNRNNYQQLRNAATVVSCYNPFEEMTTSIGGPSSVKAGELITLTSNVFHCDSRTYKWEVSHNGFSYHSLGTGSSVSYRGFPYYGNISVTRFRLTVTCSDGQRSIAFKSVYIENDCDDILRKPCLLILPYNGMEKGNIEPQHHKTVLLYPNPASEQVKLVLDDLKSNVIEVIAYNMLSSKKHRLFKRQLSSQKNELLLDVSRLDQGLYQMIVKDEKREIYSTRMLIQR